MKNQFNFTLSRYSFVIILILGVFLGFSCSSTGETVEVPDNLVGLWKSQESKITVREKEGFNDYSFTSGVGKIVLEFEKGNSVKGTIGLYKFTNGSLLKSNIYKVNCDSVGKIFPEDPIASKQLSLWLHTISDDSITGELRFTENNQKYPMSRFTLVKD